MNNEIAMHYNVRVVATNELVDSHLTIEAAREHMQACREKVYIEYAIPGARPAPRYRTAEERLAAMRAARNNHTFFDRYTTAHYVQDMVDLANEDEFDASRRRVRCSVVLLRQGWERVAPAPADQ